MCAKFVCICILYYICENTVSIVYVSLYMNDDICNMAFLPFKDIALYKEIVMVVSTKSKKVMRSVILSD